PSGSKAGSPTAANSYISTRRPDRWPNFPDPCSPRPPGNQVRQTQEACGETSRTVARGDCCEFPADWAELRQNAKLDPACSSHSWPWLRYARGCERLTVSPSIPENVNYG